MKKYLLPICLLVLLTNLQASAQKQMVYFLKNNGKAVGTKDSADFIRVIKEPDSGSVVYNLAEYYTNGKLKRISKTLTIDKVTLEGQCITYLKSGQRLSISAYSNGRLVGDVFTYFPNGILYTQKAFNMQTRNFDVKISNDTTGKALVVNGNGHYITYTDDMKEISTEGELKNGVKNGEWKKYKVTRDSLNVVESYSNGKLLHGQSTDKTGKVYTYGAQDEVAPMFDGGAQGFSSFLTDNVRYPAESKRNNIQGQVFVTFVIEKDGSLSDVKAVRSPDYDLEREAIRVLKSSPKWHPGYQYGRPVTVQYTVPINFSLSN